MNRRKLMVLVTSFVALNLIGSIAAIADWKPRKPINIILPYSAGGGTDSFARAIVASSSDVVPVPMIVVNKPGSAGMTGATEASNARPDGSTIMVTSAGSFLLTSMLRETDVNPFDSFQIVAQIGNLSGALAVPADSPYQSIDDLVAALKAKPGTLTWAHTGRGGFLHVAGQGFLNANELSAKDVPFKGGAGVRAAIIGSQVDFGFIGVQQSTGFEAEMRVLGLSAAERDPVLSAIPTFAEQGHSFVDVSSPIMMFAPKDTDTDVVMGLEKALRQITEKPEFAAAMAERGNAPVFLSGEEATAKLTAMRDRAGPIIKALK